MNKVVIVTGVSGAGKTTALKILENGKCLKIAPGDPFVETEVETGKLIVEGKKLAYLKVHFRELC